MDYNSANNGGNIPNHNMPDPGARNMQGPGMQGQPQGQWNPNPGRGMPANGMPVNGMPVNGMPVNGMPPNMQAPNMTGRIPNPNMPGSNMPNPHMTGRIPNPNIPNPSMPNPNMPGPNMPGLGARNMQGPGVQGRPQGQWNPNPGRGVPANGMPSNGMPQNMQNSNMYGRMPAKAAPQQQVRSRDIPEQNNSKARLFDDKGKEGAENLFGPKGIGLAIPGLTGYIYGGILVICLIAALIAFGTTHKGTGGKKYTIPTEMITYTGIFRDIYEKASAGSLGSGAGMAGTLYDEDGTEVPAAPTAIGEAPAGYGGEADASSPLPDGVTSGATMELDSGNATGSYEQAGSYDELLTQIESAIASGDTDFIGRKFAYEDENGTLKGYPQSVVDHFVTYMSTNSDKRDSLMSELSSDKYQGQNEDAFIVKLPYIKFVVNMGYDNTTISLPGFSDQVVNAGQSADIAPLLPCMYTLTISNPEWSEPVTRDIEANVNEATISINIKP